MRKRATVLIACTTVVGLIATGCGGSSDPPEIAKNEFIKQANAICVTATEKKVNPALLKFTSEVPPANKPQTKQQEEETEEAEVEFVTATLVPSVQGELDEIHDLGLPEEDQEKASQILDDIQKVVDEAEERPEAYAEEVTFTKPEEAADSYGLEDCPIG